MSTGSSHQITREAYPAGTQDGSPAQAVTAGASAPGALGLHRLGAALAAVFGGVAEFWQGVLSPGLRDSPTLSPLDIRDGGQYRR